MIQPAPANPPAARPVLDDVRADAIRYGHDVILPLLEERAAAGLETYGVPLAAWNGRDALMDARDEAADLVMYLRQAVTEGRKDLGGQYLLAMGLLVQLLGKPNQVEAAA